MANHPAAGAGSARPETPAAPEPLFTVVAGHASDEEIAALTVALAAKLASAHPLPPRRPHGEWVSRSRPLRLPVSPGPGAWRRSALPR